MNTSVTAATQGTKATQWQIDPMHSAAHISAGGPGCSATYADNTPSSAAARRLIRPIRQNHPLK